jgi:hypothetical protein
MSSQCAENQDDVDRLPPEYRLIVHEYGYAIYRALIAAKVTNPATMRHLVHEIWCGARGSTRGGRPRGFPGAANLSLLDWLLIQNGAAISGACLVRVLRQSGLVIVPVEPMPQMIDASMSTVTAKETVVTKREKHRRRLRAALETGCEQLWPHLVKTKQLEAAE